MLAVIPPRIILVAFNFCQPFLINRAVTFSQEPLTTHTTNVGYGLIAAYIIVFIGIAVWVLPPHNVTLVDKQKGIYGAIPAQNIQIHNYDARGPDLDVIQQSYKRSTEGR